MSATQILLVDDDPDIVESTAQLLYAFGYDVATCTQANRVVETMQAKRPDLVLHDARMPGLDIVAQLHAIRADPQLRNVPVLVFTALFGAKELAEEIGADGGLEKPFDPEHLKKLLRDWETRVNP